MSAPGTIEAYLLGLAQRLGPGAATDATVDELRDHLLESKQAAMLDGIGADEAERRAVAQLGELPLVVGGFVEERRRVRFRRWLGFLGRVSFARRGKVFGSKKGKAYGCSFCGKGNEAVKRLIAGPDGVFICDECVGLCNEILAESKRPAPA